MVNTSAPYSEVSIANLAVDILDDYPLQDLDDEGVVARFLARNFGPVRDELLEMYPWRFATGRYLAPATDEPAFGWTYAAELPDDCVVPREIRTGGKFNGRPVLFEHEGTVLLTDYTPPVPLIYTRRITDPAKFTPLFARCLATRLAFYGAQNITGKESYTNKTLGMFSDAYEQARLAETLKAGSQQEQNRQDILDIRLRGIG
jgi:hypothetical protein